MAEITQELKEQIAHKFYNPPSFEDVSEKIEYYADFSRSIRKLENVEQDQFLMHILFRLLKYDYELIRYVAKWDSELDKVMETLSHNKGLGLQYIAPHLKKEPYVVLQALLTAKEAGDDTVIYVSRYIHSSLFDTLIEYIKTVLHNDTDDIQADELIKAVQYFLSIDKNSMILK